MKEALEANRNMIYSLCKYFNNYGSVDDLFQAGCIGFIEAYNKFDANKGVKLSTYAYPYILGQMKKLVREDKGIKVGKDINDLNIKINKIRNNLMQELGREPTDKEIANYIGVSEYEFNMAINSSNPINSLDYAIDDDINLYDIIGSNMDMDSIIELKMAIDGLTIDEKKIILSRYMMDLTESEIAKQIGTNQVDVSRKERKILVKLKDKLI